MPTGTISAGEKSLPIEKDTKEPPADCSQRAIKGNSVLAKEVSLQIGCYNSLEARACLLFAVTLALGNVRFVFGNVKYEFGNVSLCIGDVTFIFGNVINRIGDVSFIFGDATITIGDVSFKFSDVRFNIGDVTINFVVVTIVLGMLCAEKFDNLTDYIIFCSVLMVIARSLIQK